MKAGAIAIVAAAMLAAASGCGSDEPPETPLACLEGEEAYLEALAAAPGEVRLEGGTPISDCLVPEQDPGAHAEVGSAVVAAATELNRQARRSGERDEIVELGYLVGAVQHGAAETGGIHTDLVRRLDSAARYTGPGGEAPGAAFERAFGSGYGAGLRDG